MSTGLTLPAGTTVGWAPNSKWQELALSCPAIELLCWGNRGGGKSECLLADFAQHVGQGYGEYFRGIIFRKHSRDLSDIVAKARRMLRPIFPDAEYIGGNMPEIRFKTGELLMFRHINAPEDHELYQGHEYAFVGWEELTQWATPESYEALFGICRSSYKGMPLKYRATCNPSGPGHSWVRKRFIDTTPMAVPYTDPKTKMIRVHIALMLKDNVDMMRANPDYIRSLEAISDPNRRKAWLDGSWDITSGGMFDDLWEREVHVVKPFKIPSSWYIDRSFDWGESKPFAVQWWAESDGTTPSTDKNDDNYAPMVARGTVFLFDQWYGCTGEDNKGLRLPPASVAKEIIRREKQMGRKVHPGPADNAIFNKDHSSDSIGEIMRRVGVRWTLSDKSPGSRVNGWQIFRQRLHASKPRMVDGKIDPEWMMEEPGFFVFDTCTDFIRTVPSLPRDPKKPDDVDTDVEDHDADAMRYRLTRTHKPAETTQVVGMW